MAKSRFSLILAALVASGALGCGSDEADTASTSCSETGDVTVVTEEGCPSTACGGALAGCWSYSGGCLDASWILSLCPEATYALDSSVTGSISFEGGELTRTLTATTSGTVSLPGSCLTGSGCDQYNEPVGALDWITNATCTVVPDTGCDCAVSGVYHDSETVSYSASGSTFTTGSGDEARTFEYCIEGGTLSYMETTSGGLPIVFELSRG